MTSRTFRVVLRNTFIVATVLGIGVFSGEALAAERLNVLFINVDDMNCDSVGVYGCKTPDITAINTIASKKSFPMRAVNGRKYGYIWNQWSDGKTKFRNESMGGLTFNAMKAAAADDAEIAARVNHFIYRTPEELYDYEVDPDALHNLAGDPAHNSMLAEYRALMLKQMEDSHDPQLADYKKMLSAIK